MNAHIAPTKYFVVCGSSSDDYLDDYHAAVKEANLPPATTFDCMNLRAAIHSVVMNTEVGIECVVCCTDLARAAQNVPSTVRSVSAVALPDSPFSAA